MKSEISEIPDRIRQSRALHKQLGFLAHPPPPQGRPGKYSFLRGIFVYVSQKQSWWRNKQNPESHGSFRLVFCTSVPQALALEHEYFFDYLILEWYVKEAIVWRFFQYTYRLDSPSRKLLFFRVIVLRFLTVKLMRNSSLDLHTWTIYRLNSLANSHPHFHRIFSYLFFLCLQNC